MMGASCQVQEAIMKLKPLFALLIILAGCRQQPDLPSSFALRRQLQVAVNAPKPEIFPEQVITQLRSGLYQTVMRDKLPGVVLSIATSEGVWVEGAGWADVEQKQLMEGGDRFRIASLTKMFVAVVCLQLAEDGVLHLNDKVADWLPSDANRLPNGKQITIRQLLNHTSGLPDPYSETFEQAVKSNPSHKWKVQEVLASVEGEAAAVAPGSFFYSNANYLLLQQIIEKATGNSLAQEVRQRIIEPLELKNTFLEIQEPGGFVQGYQDWNRDGKLKNVTKPRVNDGLGFGDGGLVSNAADLTRFMRSLFDGKLLRSESLSKMMTLVESDQRGGYGLGIRYTPTLWGEAWGHSGKTMGFMSDMMYLPAHDMIIVVWTNRGDGSQESLTKLRRESLQEILGETGY
jgi:D-alanyl-D-alanine carboxypeptidase